MATTVFYDCKSVQLELDCYSKLPALPKECYREAWEIGPIYSLARYELENLHYISTLHFIVYTFKIYYGVS